MMAFQSREAVRRYRESLDQLRAGVRQGQLGVQHALFWFQLIVRRSRTRRVDEEEHHAPDRGDRFDVPVEPADDAARLKVEDDDWPVLPAHSEVVAGEVAARVEPRADGGRVDRGVEVLGERGGERVCGQVQGQPEPHREVAQGRERDGLRSSRFIADEDEGRLASACVTRSEARQPCREVEEAARSASVRVRGGGASTGEAKRGSPPPLAVGRG